MAIQTQSSSPLLSIWIKPRETIRKIVDTDPTKHVILLAMLAGIGNALDRSSSRNAADLLPLATILLICILAGPVGGIISLYIGGALFRWTGSWLGGKATSEEVRAAIAWASVPSIFILPIWIPELLIFGEELFTSSTPRLEANPLLGILLLGFAAFEIVVGIWGLVIFMLTLGEVHGFSAWKALAATVLGLLVVVVPILCIAGGFALLAGMAG
jgi:hypothetical protein